MLMTYMPEVEACAVSVESGENPMLALGAAWSIPVQKGRREELIASTRTLASRLSEILNRKSCSSVKGFS